MRVSLTIILLFSWLLNSAYGQDKKFVNGVDSFMNLLVLSKDFSGSVLIAKNKTILYKTNKGYSDFDKGKPFADNTPACIGSITKTFTAVAIAMLWQEGRLKLDEKLSDFIKGIPLSDSITIRMLLNHTSGLKRETLDFTYQDGAEIVSKDYTSQELIDSISKYPLDFKPGTRQSYSNAGYAVLARIVELVSHLNYNDYLEKIIFKPLKMNNSVAMPNNSPAIANGYDPAKYPKGVMQTPMQNSSVYFGAGNIFSTTGDLNKWVNAFSERAVILSHAGWDTILNNSYGFGSYLVEGRNAIGHDGIVGGFIANMDYFQKEKTAVIFISNIRSGALEYLKKGLSDLVFSNKTDLPSLPSYSNTIIAGSGLDSLAGVYELFPGFNLTIRRTAGNLFLKGSGGYYTYLESVANNTFFYRSLFAFIEFIKVPNGYSLVWRDLLSGQAYPAKKI